MIEEEELSKEEVDKLEKIEMLKFAITFFSIISIVTITTTMIILNGDYNLFDDELIPNGNDCGGCDDEYYYNELVIMVHKQFLEVLYERYN